MQSESNYSRKILKFRKFEELSDGDVFIFPGDRQASAKETGFVKIGGNKYAGINDFRENSTASVKQKTVPETEVFLIKGISPFSRN